eukprot:scaffold12056_cov146-Isochrysis_galbana.AAC.4
MGTFLCGGTTTKENTDQRSRIFRSDDETLIASHRGNLAHETRKVTARPATAGLRTGRRRGSCRSAGACVPGASTELPAPVLADPRWLNGPPALCRRGSD